VLWRFEVFDSQWDHLVATVWILRRLVPLEIECEKWKLRVNDALSRMIKIASKNNFLSTLGIKERFRIEARIASAVTITKDKDYIERVVSKNAEKYLEYVKPRLEEILRNKITDKELDLSTALFLVDSMIDPEKLKEHAIEVAEKDG
jgi:hypothetical protein